MKLTLTAKLVALKPRIAWKCRIKGYSRLFFKRAVELQTFLPIQSVPLRLPTFAAMAAASLAARILKVILLNVLQLYCTFKK